MYSSRAAALPLILLVGQLAACGRGAAPVGSQAVSALRLPAPAGLPRMPAFADGDRFRTAAQYEAGLPSAAVAAEGPALRFSPDWHPAAGRQQLAYCIYRWTLDGYSGNPSVVFDWDTAPAAGTTVWAGRANWVRNRWDWQQLTVDAAAADVFPLADYLQPDGSIAVALAVAADGARPDPLLERVFIGADSSVVPGNILFVADTATAGTPISELIYGVNEIEPADQALARPSLVRFGGNRWTAYNWENNASNAGTDYLNQNDDYMSASPQPGEGIRVRAQAAYDGGAGATLVTIPIQGYCAADTLGGGDVNQTPNYLAARFRQNLPAKGAPLSLNPDLADSFVYQDELLNWLDATFPGKLGAVPAGMFVSLDNEPDLWEETHPRIQQVPLSYDALIARQVDTMLALRAVVPGVCCFGPASYGFNGYATLQDAPDAGAHGFFLDYYLQQMAQAEVDHGARLLNVLDLHWYPEARGGGVRITGDDVSPAVVAARLQAPRSLWDATYEEDSWIVNDYYAESIHLLPRIQAKIDFYYRDTLLALTEYNYGAGGHISGGLAQADVLGVLGREGVYAACMWPLSSDSSYIYGAFALYRNYDGAGGRFGSRAIGVDWADREGYSAYAAFDAAPAARLTLVLINKLAAARLARVDLASAGYGVAEVYTLSAVGGPQPVRQPDLALLGPSFNVALPAYSATLLVLE